MSYNPQVGDRVFRVNTTRRNNQVKLWFETYIISILTPKGYWVKTRYSQDKYKWINSTARKRFAYPTHEEALNEFRHRNYSFIKHTRAMLQYAETRQLFIDSEDKVNNILRELPSILTKDNVVVEIPLTYELL